MPLCQDTGDGWISIADDLVGNLYNHKVRTRPVSDDDLTSLRSIFEANRTQELGWNDLDPRLLGSLLAIQWNGFIRQLGSPDNGSNDLAIDVDHQVVGWLRLRNGIDGIHLLHIEVHPDWQNKGIGSAIIQHLIRFCGRHQIRLTLRTNRSGRALSLYQRLGFIETESSETDLLMTLQPASG